VRRQRNRLSIGTIVRSEIRVLVLYELLPLYALWLAFATPPTQLPFPVPAAGSSWLFLPALVTYTVIAVLVHGALSLYGVGVVVGWLIQFNTPNKSRIDVLAILLGYIALVVGWEVQQWPETFLVLIEFFLITGTIPQLLTSLLWGPRTIDERPDLATRVTATYYPLFTLAVLLVVLWHDSFLIPLWLAAAIVTGFLLSLRYGPEFSRGPLPKERISILLGASLLVNAILWGAALVVLAMGQPIAPFAFALDIAAVFFVLIQLDLCYSLAFGPQRFGRAFLLPLITLALTLAAAGGLFAAVTRNAGFGYETWLEGGVAAAVFLLFFPLTELAKESVRVNAESTFGVPQLPSPLVPAVPLLAGGRVVSASGGNERSKAQEALPRQAQLNPIEKQYQMLQFQGGIFFVAAAIVYHLIASNPDVLSALNGNLIGFIFSGIAAFAGILALLAEQNNSAPRAVLLLLLALTAALVGADVLLNVGLSGAATQVVASSGAHPFASDQDLLLTVRNIVQESLVLLAAGQVFYLFVVIVASLAGQAERNRGDARWT
jgi:hypothetical protein